jgi:DNA transposition AAA+ family ATPase
MAENMMPIDKLVQEARTQGARMLRDEETLTPARQDELLTKIRAYIEQERIPLSKLALRLGLTESVISQVLSQTYKASPAKHIRALAAVIDEKESEKEAVKPRGYVATSVARRIYSSAKYVKQYNGIALAYGPAGIGKTITLKALAADIPASIYVCMRTGCETPLSVAEAVGNAARVTPHRRNVRGWLEALEGTLAGSNRLILIDEIHKLIGQRSDQSLHLLRDLHDSTDCPMVWVGTSDIVLHIQSGQSKGRGGPLDQLSSRIGPWTDLAEGTAARGGGKPLFTTEDIRKVFHSEELRISTDGIEYLKKLANVPGAGGLRACVKLIELAAYLAKGQIITAALLDEAQPLRSGSQTAALRRAQMKLQEEAAAVPAMKVG